MFYINRIIFWSFMSIIAAAAFTMISDSYIKSFQKYSTNDLSQFEQHQVGMVLGTAKYTQFGTVNLFYKYRLESTLELYHNGVIKRILVSGDNGTLAYNEPRMFFNDLVAGGVKPNDIFLDFAGFRTLDSVVRAKKVFKQDKLIIISQQFHNERALFLARKNGIDAVAFNARSVDFSFSRKTFIREKLARVKAVLDYYILNTQPRFLGEQITIS